MSCRTESFGDEPARKVDGRGPRRRRAMASSCELNRQGRIWRGVWSVVGIVQSDLSCCRVGRKLKMKRHGRGWMLDGLKRQHARLWTVRPNALAGREVLILQSTSGRLVGFRRTEQQKGDQTFREIWRSARRRVRGRRSRRGRFGGNAREDPTHPHLQTHLERNDSQKLRALFYSGQVPRTSK